MSIKLQIFQLALLIWIPFLNGKDRVSYQDTKKLMDQTKDEAQDFAKRQRDALCDGLRGGDPQKGTPDFSSDNFLPENEKGKSFNPKIAAVEQDLKVFIDAASKRERLEGTEEFFTSSLHVIENPQFEAGIASDETETVSIDERFETCLEAGTYQLLFSQKLVVEVIPAITRQIRQCRGHEEQKKFHFESDAKEYRKKKEKEFGKDASINFFNVEIVKGGLVHRYVVVTTSTHRDDVVCNHSLEKEQVIQAASEKDRWQTDDPEALSSLSGNPNCHLLYSQLLAGPETRFVNGSSVFRDSWERQLFFSCGDAQDSKCAKLREKGARLHKKKCLKKTPFNEHECDLWEKVYKISEGRISQDPKVSFSSEDLWGLDGNFDSSYEPNADFGTAATTLAIFSDIKLDIEESNADFNSEKTELFKGISRECQRSFIEGVLYDCCSKMDGIAVASKLCRCTSEEKELAAKREEGKCHYVGTYHKNLGTEKIQVFCCFPTKLARVIHEEGRSQLGIKWGSAEKPNCAGFIVNQLKEIDFNRVDLSEVIEDLKVDKEFIQRKIEDVSRDLQSEESKLRMKQQTEKTLQSEKEKGGLNG